MSSVQYLREIKVSFFLVKISNVFYQKKKKKESQMHALDLTWMGHRGGMGPTNKKINKRNFTSLVCFDSLSHCRFGDRDEIFCEE